MLIPQPTCHIVLHRRHHLVRPQTPQDTQQLHAGHLLVLPCWDGLLLGFLRLKHSAPLLKVVREEVHQVLQGGDDITVGIWNSIQKYSIVLLCIVSNIMIIYENLCNEIQEVPPLLCLILSLRFNYVKCLTYHTENTVPYFITSHVQIVINSKVQKNQLTQFWLCWKL